MIRVLTYNILNGGDGRESLLGDVIGHAHADIIVLQEVANPAFVQNLARELDCDWFVADSNHARRKLALLSRFPITARNSHHLFPLHRTLLEAQIEIAPNRRLALFGVHLVAPSHLIPFEWWQAWELRVILQRVRAVAAQPCIIAGDFNAIAPHEAVDVAALPPWLRQAIALQGGRIARRTIATMQRAGLIDCYRLLHLHDDGHTVPARAPNGRLDYIFVNDALRGAVRSCDVVAEPSAVRAASDHLPVMMDFCLDGVATTD
ncbi:MAG: endonuclease/exonuclease/phosphatase family protein [Chloroflexota bacterium]